MSEFVFISALILVVVEVFGIVQKSRTRRRRTGCTAFMQSIWERRIKDALDNEGVNNGQ